MMACIIKGDARFLYEETSEQVWFQTVYVLEAFQGHFDSFCKHTDNHELLLKKIYQ